MAGAGGFEPPTFRFVAECSIQLSYAPRSIAEDMLRESAALSGSLLDRSRFKPGGLHGFYRFRLRCFQRHASGLW